MTLTVTIPNSYYQIDFVCGPAINQLEPNQNNDAYGPDAANILYHAEDRFISSDNGGTTVSHRPTPTPTSPSTPLRRSSSSTSPLTDSATLSGGYNPTGTITFYLFAPGVTPNATDSNNVYSDTVTVSGNGTYTTAPAPIRAATPDRGRHLPVGGRLQRRWKNSPAAGTFGSEPETVTHGQPVDQTTPNPTSVAYVRQSVDADRPAVLSGGNSGPARSRSRCIRAAQSSTPRP